MHLIQICGKNSPFGHSLKSCIRCQFIIAQSRLLASDSKLAVFLLDGLGALLISSSSVGRESAGKQDHAANF